MANKTIEKLLDEIKELQQQNSALNDIQIQLKKTEKDLLQSKEELQALTEASVDTIFVLTKTGVFTYISPSVKENFGYVPEDVIGCNFTKFVPAKETPHILKILKDVFNKRKITNFRTFIKHKENEIIPVEISGQLVKRAGKYLAQGTIRDIRDRIESEKVLQERDKFYRILFELSPSGIVLEDKKGIILDVNSAFCQMTGYSRDELIGQRVHMLAHPDYRQNVDKNITRLLSGEHLQFVEKSIKKDGTYCYMQLNERRILLPDGEYGFLSIIQDMTEQVLAENALRDSEERYRELVESLPQAVILYDLNGRMIYVNKVLVKLMKADSSRQMLGRSVYDSVHPDSRSLVEKRFKALINGKNQPAVDEQGVNFDGEVIDIEVSSQRIVYKGEPAIMSVVTDICERKKSAEELKQSEQTYRGLFDNATDAIYVQDKQGRFLDVNKAVLKMYGYPRKFFIGNTPEPLSAPGKNDLDKIARHIGQAFKGKAQQFEFWGKRKNGEIFPKIVRLNKGNYFGQEIVFAFATDISEHKKAEEALRESESKFRTIVENSHAAIILIDDNYKIIYTNPQLSHITGYSQQEIINRDFNKDFRFALDDNIRKLLVDRYKRRQKDEKIPSDYEFKFQRKDGSWCWVEIRSAVVKESGKNPMTVAQLLDISERKEAEKLQNIVYQISQSVDSSTDLNELYRVIHKNIQQVMDARNFYIALYDEKIDLIEFPYYVDEKEDYIPARKPAKGWTEYVLNSGKSQVCDAKRHKEMARKGEVDLIGTASAIWIGVPLILEERTIGVMAVQHYSDAHAFGFKHVRIMEYVSSQVAKAIHRKRAEEALQQSEKKYKQLIDNSLTGIYITQDRILKFCNQNFAEIFGYDSPEEILGIQIIQLVFPESWNIVDEEIRWREMGEKETSRYEFKCVKKDKTVIDVEVLGGRVLYDGIPAMQGTMIDITDRKRAENTIRASEKRYRQLFDFLPYGGEVLDPKGNIIECSPSTARMLGYGRDELTGKHITTLLDKDSIAIFKNKFPQIIGGKAVSAEIGMIRKDGRVLNILRAAQLLYGEDGKTVTGVLALNVDITERKMAEQLLQLTHDLGIALSAVMGIDETLRLCVDAAIKASGLDSGGVYLVDENTGELSLKYHTGLSDRFVKLVSRFEADSPKAKLVMEGKPVYINYQQLSEQLKIPNVESLKASAIIPVLIENHIVASLNISSHTLDNISQSARTALETIASQIGEVIIRSQKEQELALLATVVEQAVESIVITDPLGNIQYVNPAFEQVTGYTLREAAGQNPRFLKSGSHDNAFYKELWSTITKKEKWQGLFINKRKNGDLFYERTDIFPIVDEKGAILNYVAVKRDITLERKLEQQLQQAQKMEAIGTLSGGVAHDFNNLLTVINGHADIALMHTHKDLRAHGDLLAIRNAGKRAEKLTSQLLAFSRKQLYEPKVLDINKVISGLEKMLRRLISEDIYVETQLNPDLPYIKVDPGQLEQILINLVINARDAIKSKAERSDSKMITIKTELVDLDSLFVENNPGSRTGAHVLISVNDTGTGMDENLRNRVFEPFFTTKEVGKGTGLGLSMVYGVVKQNKGCIYILSEPGKGSSINIYWPITEELPAPELIRKLDYEAFSGTESILLVEDDQGVRNFTCMALKNFGYDIIEASHGKNAQEIIKKERLQIDLLITDLIMPEMNGQDLADTLKVEIGLEKILFVSGYTYNYLLREGSLQEGINFLQKPYSIEDLLKTVRKILDT